MSLDQSTVIATLPRNDREQVRIGLSEFKGRTRLDIRVWYLAGDEYRPGKQGISLPLEQLPSIVDALQRAQRPGKEVRAPGP
jgi:hypothetical protein